MDNSYKSKVEVAEELGISVRVHHAMEEDKKWALVPFGHHAFKITVDRQLNKSFRL